MSERRGPFWSWRDDPYGIDDLTSTSISCPTRMTTRRRSCRIRWMWSLASTAGGTSWPRTVSLEDWRRNGCIETTPF